MALSEIEIYVREDPATVSQTPYSNGQGAGYILPEVYTKTFEFDQVCKVILSLLLMIVQICTLCNYKRFLYISLHFLNKLPLIVFRWISLEEPL